MYIFLEEIVSNNFQTLFSEHPFTLKINEDLSFCLSMLHLSVFTILKMQNKKKEQNKNKNPAHRYRKQIGGCHGVEWGQRVKGRNIKKI